MSVWYRWRHISIVGLILVICVAPLWFSHVLINRADSKHWSKNAKGELIQPTSVRSFGVLQAGKVFQLGSLAKRWHMIYMTKQCCDADCQKSVFHLNQIRRAIKHAWAHTDVVLMMPAQCTHALPADMKPIILRMTPAEQSAWMALLPKQLQVSQAQGAQVYLIDPRGYLMMAYSKHDPAMDVFQDLKHVLWVNRGNQD